MRPGARAGGRAPPKDRRGLQRARPTLLRRTRSRKVDACCAAAGALLGPRPARRAFEHCRHVLPTPSLSAGSCIPFRRHAAASPVRCPAQQRSPVWCSARLRGEDVAWTMKELPGVTKVCMYCRWHRGGGIHRTTNHGQERWGGGGRFACRALIAYRICTIDAQQRPSHNGLFFSGFASSSSRNEYGGRGPVQGGLPGLRVQPGGARCVED